MNIGARGEHEIAFLHSRAVQMEVPSGEHSFPFDNDHRECSYRTGPKTRDTQGYEGTMMLGSLWECHMQPQKKCNLYARTPHSCSLEKHYIPQGQISHSRCSREECELQASHNMQRVRQSPPQSISGERWAHIPWDASECKRAALRVKSSLGLGGSLAPNHSTWRRRGRALLEDQANAKKGRSFSLPAPFQGGGNGPPKDAVQSSHTCSTAIN